MCLAIPAQVKRIVDKRGLVQAFGSVEEEVDVSLVPEARVGDWVLVHVGFAIQIMTDEQAREVADVWESVLNDRDTRSSQSD